MGEGRYSAGGGWKGYSAEGGHEMSEKPDGENDERGYCLTII